MLLILWVVEFTDLDGLAAKRLHNPFVERVGQVEERGQHAVALTQPVRATDRLDVLAGDPGGFDDRHFVGRGQGDGGPAGQDLSQEHPHVAPVLKQVDRGDAPGGRGIASHQDRVELSQPAAEMLKHRDVPSEH